MSFENIHNAGVVARLIGKGAGDNPYYRSENLPGDSAAAYRAWQMKAEAWERGWMEQDRRLRPLLEVLRRNGKVPGLPPRAAARASARIASVVAGC